MFPWLQPWRIDIGSTPHLTTPPPTPPLSPSTHTIQGMHICPPPTPHPIQYKAPLPYLYTCCTAVYGPPGWDDLSANRQPLPASSNLGLRRHEQHSSLVPNLPNVIYWRPPGTSPPAGSGKSMNGSRRLCCCLLRARHGFPRAGPLTLKIDRTTWPFLKIDMRHEAYCRIYMGKILVT